MLKKIIVLLIILIPLILGIIDYKRVVNNEFPLFMIRVSDNNSNFQNYIGLGYKLKRKVNVSYQEPLYLDDEIKFGLWFFTWKLNYYTLINYLYTIKTIETKDCDRNPKYYYTEDNQDIYTYCLDSILVNNDIDLKDYFKNNNIKFNNFIEGLIFAEEAKNGKYKIYKDTGKTTNISTGFTNKGLTILKCNVSGNKNIYIGPKWMNYENGFCQ
jgi:hypothetical protein